MRRISQRRNSLILLALLTLLLVTNATLVAQDFHLAAFDRDCPACRVSASATFGAEQCAQLDITPQLEAAWDVLPKDIVEYSILLVVTSCTRAPPS